MPSVGWFRSNAKAAQGTLRQWGRKIYSVFADPINALVRIRLSGFFDGREVLRFWQEEQTVARAALARHCVYDLLIETTGGPQGQDVLEAFQRVILESPVKARRIGIISASALLRMQIRRMLVSDTLQVFETISEAEAWLSNMAKEVVTVE